MLTTAISIENESGLHVRPASILAGEAQKYASDVRITFLGNTYNAKSVIKVLSAGIKRGHEIQLSVCGNDEKQAMEALVALIQNGLDD